MRRLLAQRWNQVLARVSRYSPYLLCNPRGSGARGSCCNSCSRIIRRIDANIRPTPSRPHRNRAVTTTKINNPLARLRINIVLRDHLQHECSTRIQTVLTENPRIPM